MKERIECPICNSIETSFFCNLDEEYLITSDSGWKHDLAAVCETGSMIIYLLERAFPFLDEGDKGG